MLCFSQEMGSFPPSIEKWRITSLSSYFAKESVHLLKLRRECCWNRSIQSAGVNQLMNGFRKSNSCSGVTVNVPTSTQLWCAGMTRRVLFVLYMSAILLKCNSFVKKNSPKFPLIIVQEETSDQLSNPLVHLLFAPVWFLHVTLTEMWKQVIFGLRKLILVILMQNMTTFAGQVDSHFCCYFGSNAILVLNLTLMSLCQNMEKVWDLFVIGGLIRCLQCCLEISVNQ